ncbi:MAG TPA: hypothetical protein VF571_16975 [Pyrinomonadaceae bacterium]|jgi:hypothetical protein
MLIQSFILSKRFFPILIFASLFLIQPFFEPSHAQDKPQGNKSKEVNIDSKTKSQTKKLDKLGDEERKTLIQQALQTLKDISIESRNIDNLQQRVQIISNVSDLLWNNEQNFTGELLRNSIFALTNDLQEVFSDKKRRNEAKPLIKAINTLINTLAQKDLKLARDLQEKYQKVKEDALLENTENKRNLDERFELASEGLTSDPEHSATLVSQIIQQGIPITFVQYLFDLKKENGALADNLYRLALQNLVTKSSYTSRDSVLLSAYAFNEAVVLLPTQQRISDNQLEFGVFTFQLTPPKAKPDMRQVAMYINACKQFISTYIARIYADTAVSAKDIAAFYFLINKLKAYESFYGSSAQQISWGNIEQQVIALSQNSGMTSQDLEVLSGYAIRAATNNKIFLFDAGSAFEKAENSTNEHEKLGYLIQGIILLIQDRRFIEAEQKIFKITDLSATNELKLFLNTKAAINAIEARDWNELNKRVEKVDDKKIKAFLLIKAANSMIANRSFKLEALEYLRQAKRHLENIEDKLYKTKAFIYISSLELTSEPISGFATLIEAKDLINNVPEYAGEALEIVVPITSSRNFFNFSLNEKPFEASFTRAAKSDWFTTQSLISQVKSQYLRSLAQIAATKAILANKN